MDRQDTSCMDQRWSHTLIPTGRKSRAGPEAPPPENNTLLLPKWAMAASGNVRVLVWTIFLLSLCYAGERKHSTLSWRYASDDVQPTLHGRLFERMCDAGQLDRILQWLSFFLNDEANGHWCRWVSFHIWYSSKCGNYYLQVSASI